MNLGAAKSVEKTEGHRGRIAVKYMEFRSLINVHRLMVERARWTSLGIEKARIFRSVLYTL